VSLASDFANRALESEAWARDRLTAHAGKTMRFDIGPARIAFAIETGGRLAASEASPDLTIAIDPLRLPPLLAQPSRWSELTAAEGDAALAATLAELAPTLPWFVERLLARALGPIAGQQAADAGRRLLALPEYAGERFADSFARYVGDEARLAVRSADMRRFATDVAELATRVDALARRVDALGKQQIPRSRSG
jgi:ubiquinone biosynthesis accessory factor UbiJ